MSVLLWTAVIVIWAACQWGAFIVGARAGHPFTGWLLGACLGAVGLLVALNVFPPEPKPAWTPDRLPPRAPGWYVDPVGHFPHRMWDGTAWTDQVRNGLEVFTDHMPTERERWLEEMSAARQRAEKERNMNHGKSALC